MSNFCVAVILLLHLLLQKKSIKCIQPNPMLWYLGPIPDPSVIWIYGPWRSLIASLSFTSHFHSTVQYSTRLLAIYSYFPTLSRHHGFMVIDLVETLTQNKNKQTNGVDICNLPTTLSKCPSS